MGVRVRVTAQLRQPIKIRIIVRARVSDRVRVTAQLRHPAELAVPVPEAYVPAPHRLHSAPPALAL